MLIWLGLGGIIILILKGIVDFTKSRFKKLLLSQDVISRFLKIEQISLDFDG